MHLKRNENSHECIALNKIHSHNKAFKNMQPYYSYILFVTNCEAAVETRALKVVFKKATR